mmetsp:Transcript_1941/g.4172  ORF Transcript_1941/g.4172 Transcript_1941/m.4172 type:complete len:90 (+) Transcript_1941:1873-2142(+)
MKRFPFSLDPGVTILPSSASPADESIETSAAPPGGGSDATPPSFPGRQESTWYMARISKWGKLMLHSLEMTYLSFYGALSEEKKNFQPI